MDDELTPEQHQLLLSALEQRQLQYEGMAEAAKEYEPELATQLRIQALALRGLREHWERQNGNGLDGAGPDGQAG